MGSSVCPMHNEHRTILLNNVWVVCSTGTSYSWCRQGRRQVRILVRSATVSAKWRERRSIPLVVPVPNVISHFNQWAWWWNASVTELRSVSSTSKEDKGNPNDPRNAFYNSVMKFTKQNLGQDTLLEGNQTKRIRYEGNFAVNKEIRKRVMRVIHKIILKSYSTYDISWFNIFNVF